MNEVGLLTTHGTMATVYSAGANLAIAEKYRNWRPRVAISCSGSSGAMSYYLAGQDHFIRECWLNRLSTTDFIPKKNSINIDYLINVFRELYPLDINALRNSPTKLFIPATNYHTGETRFFSNKENIDMYKVLHATCSVPFFYGQKVEIDGEEYIDGAVSVGIREMIAKALEEGATKMIVVDTTEKKDGTRKDRLKNWIEDKVIRWYAVNQRRKLQQALLRFAKTQKYEATDPSVFVLRPSRRLPMGSFQNDPLLLEEAFELGYTDATQSKEIEGMIAA